MEDNEVKILLEKELKKIRIKLVKIQADEKETLKLLKRLKKLIK